MPTKSTATPSKLTTNQRDVLKTMRKHPEYKCAYELHTTMNTMYALLSRGFIKRTNYGDPVWLGWERTGMEFAVTEKGHEVPLT